MITELRRAALLLIGMMVLTGIVYPLAVTGIAQLAFPSKADGSFIAIDGVLIGSELIAQRFDRPEYFQPRPSAVFYNAASSGGSNRAPTSKALIESITERTQILRGELGERQIPIELVTASGSGLDPHISPEAAYAQAVRVGAAREMAEGDVWKLISDHIEDRTFTLFGEPRVNVLKLNLALDALQNENAAPR